MSRLQGVDLLDIIAVWWNMYLLILCIALCSPTITNTKEYNEDDEWDEISKLSRKPDTLLEELDPFNLDAYRKNHFTDDEAASVKEVDKHEEIKTETESSRQLTADKLFKDETLGKELSHSINGDIAHTFMQRFINMLISKCNSSDDDSAEKLKMISVKLDITRGDLKKLQDMKNMDDSPSVIRVLYNIISTMKVDNRHEEYTSYASYFFRLIASTDVWWDLSVLIFAAIPLIIFAFGGKLMKILVVTLLTAFSVSYYATYKQMLSKVKIDNERILSKNLKCASDELAWYQTIFWFSAENECQKKWNALYGDPEYEITPVKIISHMFAVAAFQPLEQFGLMFSQFSSKIFESQSFLYGMIVFTTAVLIILIGLIACCYGMFHTNRTIKLDQQCSYGRRDVVDAVCTSNMQQMFPEDIRDRASNIAYRAPHHQPIYIFTNFPNNAPKNARIENNSGIEAENYGDEASSQS